MKAEPILPWKQSPEYQRIYEVLLKRKVKKGKVGPPSDHEIDTYTAELARKNAKRIKDNPPKQKRP